MGLTDLRVSHFRNLVVQELTVPPQGVAIVGENAQGKTNFLEAIYYLETFRSFRGARDDEVLHYGADAFRVVGAAEHGDRATEVTAAFERKGRRKKVTVDGSEPDRIGDAVGRIAVVAFSPTDLAIVSGGPAERRRLLDVILSLNRADYLRALQRYRHALAQRNAVLRDGRSGPALEAWDEPLTEAASRVTWSRRRWLEDVGPSYARCHGILSGGTEGRVGYEPSIRLDEAGSREDVAAAHRDALARSAANERRLGTTVVGPHRDEVSIEVRDGDRWLDVRRFGSGGQRRTAAIVLRVVEAETVRAARGQEPLVLLDDVFAELDPGRSERVLAFFESREMGQVILTAPKESDVRFRADSLPRWSVRSGRIAT